MLRAVLELSTDLPPTLLRRLAFEGYGASADGEVVLVIDPDVADRVHRALDDAVGAIGLDVAGTRFFHGRREELIRLAEAARVVVASSGRFRALLDEHELSHRTPEEGLRDLGGAPAGVPETVDVSGAPARAKEPEPLANVEVP